MASTYRKMSLLMRKHKEINFAFGCRETWKGEKPRKYLGHFRLLFCWLFLLCNNVGKDGRESTMGILRKDCRAKGSHRPSRSASHPTMFYLKLKTIRCATLLFTQTLIKSSCAVRCVQLKPNKRYILDDFIVMCCGLLMSCTGENMRKFVVHGDL